MTEVTETSGPRLRRQPQQARSRARVEAVLTAADRILTTDGYEALTMRRIADDAGVPVGSIYQFYPDKGSVVSALGERYIGSFEAAIGALVAQADRGELTDMVGTVVDVYADLFRAQPGFVTLWSGRHLSPELARADEANNAAIADGLRRIMESLTGRPGGELMERATRIMVRVADTVLHDVFRADGEADPELLTELKRMMRLYWADLQAELGSGPQG
ncbi:TetR/AcrR family transcriptional regulator [Streptacidiphilus jiangxiensis]|uniref:DNA-binding transcriptional regulator, AcrR family n=1 Tax=Streptacidiphilus jiangxiensis TaxID=235985 RepID=A0A1H7TSF5_STRJI|nr:TetR/AcrR family transcriptional regulator [Streptacidiphilus jiangxiensis]SEL87485.1 DNA-binding transcriptional regulator, AcrR family [Streptacidiphilus jiangxiensis]